MKPSVGTHIKGFIKGFLQYVQIHRYVFGTYELSTTLKEDDIEIILEGEGKKKQYFRRTGKDEIEKIIYAEGGNLVVCPVEPVTLPQEGVAEHLLIELNKPLIIEPGVTDTIFVNFPIYFNTLFRFFFCEIY